MKFYHIHAKTQGRFQILPEKKDCRMPKFLNNDRKKNRR